MPTSLSIQSIPRMEPAKAWALGPELARNWSAASPRRFSGVAEAVSFSLGATQRMQSGPQPGWTKVFPGHYGRIRSPVRGGVVTRKIARPVTNRRAWPSRIRFWPVRTRAVGSAFAKRISPRRRCRRSLKRIAIATRWALQCLVRESQCCQCAIQMKGRSHTRRILSHYTDTCLRTDQIPNECKMVA